MNNEEPSSSPNSSSKEKEIYKKLFYLLKENKLNEELLSNLPLFVTRQVFMRQLFFYELYKKILDIHGVIMEFGCRWGTNLSTLIALRGYLEPYNHNRTIIGFDTFTGLSGVTKTDFNGPLAKEGAYSTNEKHDLYLNEILSCMENFCPIDHIKKYLIVKGDVRKTLPKYLLENKQTVIALAYLDMDLYDPTKKTLEAIKPHLTKGSIIVFDEMNWKELPGPTLALKDVFGLSKYSIRRSPLQPIPGYIIFDDL